MSPMKKFVLISALIATGSLAQASPRLEKLSLDPNQISVSGVSAGAMMAVQMNVIYSSWIHGMGSIAGGIFGCANGDSSRALSVCMKSPEQINVQDYVSKIATASKNGKIDPLENLKNSRIFIFAGSNDTVILPQASNKLLSMYQALVPANQIGIRAKIPSGHGMPTLNYGNSCNQEGAPWLNNCGYDAAGETLNQLYGKLNPRVPMIKSNLKAFSQGEFGASGASMGADGYIYTPAVCTAGNVRCRLHIAFHGCQQSPQYVRDAYIAHAGYNEWAESNAIVVLYPTASFAIGNPNACWDWWGYTGSDYLTNTGKQNVIIKAMVGRLFGKN